MSACVVVCVCVCGCDACRLSAAEWCWWGGLWMPSFGHAATPHHTDTYGTFTLVKVTATAQAHTEIVASVAAIRTLRCGDSGTPLSRVARLCCSFFVLLLRREFEIRQKNGFYNKCTDALMCRCALVRGLWCTVLSFLSSLWADRSGLTLSAPFESRDDAKTYSFKHIHEISDK